MNAELGLGRALLAAPLEGHGHLESEQVRPEADAQARLDRQVVPRPAEAVDRL